MRNQPMTYPDTISVYHRLQHSPAASATPPTALSLDCVVLSHRHRRVAARTEEDIAIYDYRVARRAEMPRFMREVLADTHRLQEVEMARARARIWELSGMVRELERETWDCEDAVEDIGSTAKEVLE